MNYLVEKENVENSVKTGFTIEVPGRGEFGAVLPNAADWNSFIFRRLKLQLDFSQGKVLYKYEH